MSVNSVVKKWWPLKMNEVTVTVQLSTAVITEQLFFLAHKTSGMLLQSPPHSVHSRLLFFIVYQLLGNFTLWRRRKKRRSPRRTHLYSSGSLSRRLWRCSRCASFVGFTLIQLPERTLQERIIITEKNKSRSSLSNSFVRLIFRFSSFPPKGSTHCLGEQPVNTVLVRSGSIRSQALMEPRAC